MSSHALLVLAALRLFAAPAAVLEPDAGTSKRIQPRQLTASSFLRNGWNQYEQNYLPQYVADDDPATAWVEGASGPGAGESIVWIGPRLKKARAFKVFLRNGYQKTRALYAANARPRLVSVAPILAPSGAASGGALTEAGTVVERELTDEVGWQRVDVPLTGEVSGVRITIKSVYPGKTYEDTCISDVRVYVDGDDTWRADAEAEAAEDIRRFVAERKRAARSKGGASHVAFAPEYRVDRISERTTGRKDLGELDRSAVRAFALFGEVPKVAAALGDARAAAALFDGARVDGERLQPPAGWTRVKQVALARGGGEATTALADAALEYDYRLPTHAPLLHRKDMSLFEEKQDPGQSAVAALDKYLAGGFADNKACVAACKRLWDRLGDDRVDMEGGGGGACSCERECKGRCKATGRLRTSARRTDASGTWARGSLDGYTHLLRSVTEDVGERERYLEHRQDLVVYDGDRARVLLSVERSVTGEDTTVSVLAHVFDWDGAPSGRATLRGITTFGVRLQPQLGAKENVTYNVYRTVPKDLVAEKGAAPK